MQLNRPVNRRGLRQDTCGFTIIELLIATVVFSLVLLVVTAAIIQFSRVYYNGMITARTQERARAISEDISRSIQFSGDKPEGPTDVGGYTVICASGRRYTFIKDTQLTPPNNHIFVADNDPGCSGDPYSNMATATLDSNATELMGENMQLLDLTVQEVDPVTGVYKVSVRVGYGSSDDMQPDKRSCKAIILGGQFCAISELSTSVTRRLR